MLLCYFEGLTLDEAARRLRWPAGPLRSRLARAREKIRRGLDRRGVAIPAVAILDPRLRTRPYGRAFLAALPRCPLVDDRAAVAAFFGRQVTVSA